ncbi:MAG: ABC transporter permease [Armatimonadetes bacterium]|nr:ABC transporter permease [Armatimonadota bacterium]MDW8153721.1 ABC transporter permease [Armatimonadota bacterium]
MIRYLVRRLLQMVPLVFGISVILFLVLVMAPGDPTDLLLAGNPKVRAEDIRLLREIYGLEDPLPIRYLKWLRAAVRGDFGYSRIYKVPVMDLIAERLANSLWLTVPSFLLAVAVAVPVGIYSALHQYSKVDYAATFFAFFGVSIPAFWFGILLIYIFAVQLRWLPPGGFSTPGVPEGWPAVLDRLRYMVLPVLVLSFLSMAALTRYTRASMLEVIRQDYIRTARAKGLRESVVIVKHALRNALIPIVTVLALLIPGLFAGAPLTETVFSWPGVGRLLVESVLGGDYAVAQAALLFLSILVLLANLLADVAYALLDPRIRYE